MIVVEPWILFGLMSVAEVVVVDPCILLGCFWFDECGCGDGGCSGGRALAFVVGWVR